jgi:chromosome segregation ATPase
LIAACRIDHRDVRSSTAEVAMWRFLLPAAIMMTALLVLFAGALGDLHSLPALSERVVAIVGGGSPRPPSAPTSASASVAEQQATREALRRQIAVLERQASDLQQQVAQRSQDLEQRSHDLAAAQTEADRMRQAIEALRQQRSAEEAATAQRQAPVVSAPAGAPAASDAQARRDALLRETADLQRQSDGLRQQIAQQSHDLEQNNAQLQAARSETDRLRQGITVLQQQQQGATDQQAARDALARQVADLQQQVGARSRELEEDTQQRDAARAEAERLRQTVAALQQQQKAGGDQQATSEALDRQIADMQRKASDLQQQVAQRTRDLQQASRDADAARAESDRLNKGLEATRQQMEASATEQTAARKALQGQLDALQQQVAQRSQELDQASAGLSDARSETARQQEQLEALRRQRKTEEDSIAQLKTQEQQMLASAQASAGADQRQIADLRRLNGELQQQAAQRARDLDQRSRELELARVEVDKLRQSVATGRQQTAGDDAARQKPQLAAAVKQRTTAARTASVAPAPPVAQTMLSPTSAPQLLTARQWLASGRPDEARRVLAMVQTQMVLQPVTPDRPMAEGGNASATDVGNAIRWLDMGANGQAMQAIDRAISSTGASVRATGWSGYPVGQQTSYTNGLSR